MTTRGDFEGSLENGACDAVDQAVYATSDDLYSSDPTAAAGMTISRGDPRFVGEIITFPEKDANLNDRLTDLRFRCGRVTDQ